MAVDIAHEIDTRASSALRGRRENRDPSQLLRTVDALCAELRSTCGLTRVSVVLERRAMPLTISFEECSHAGVRLAPTAYLEIQLLRGSVPIGFVTLQNALVDSYSADARSAARAIVDRYSEALVQAVPA